MGSFNPIHNGHLIVAQHMLQELQLDEVWFVVSPQNPFKVDTNLWPETLRLAWVEKAIENNPKFKACDVEFTLPRPSYTYLTLKHLLEQYPQHEFVILMGSDNLERLTEWKEINTLLNGCKIVVYKRPYSDFPNPYPKQIQVMQTPLLEISATFIRQQLQKGHSIQYLVPENIRAQIEQCKPV